MEEPTDCERVKELFRKYRSLLSSDAVQSVKHFLDHDEWEIAFEGLCLELMDADLLTLSGVVEYMEVAEMLGLHEESVLRGNFWELLEEHRELLELLGRE